MNDGYEDKSHLRVNKKPKRKERASLRKLRDSIQWLKRRGYNLFDKMNNHDDCISSRVDQYHYQEGKKAYKDLIQNYNKLNNKEKKEFEELRVYLE